MASHSVTHAFQMEGVTSENRDRPPGDELDAKGKLSIDPIGGPQGPYFSTPFEEIDKKNTGTITWKQLCAANPHVWIEEERRVHYIEMFDSLEYRINKHEMEQYITRLKTDSPDGSKYGRPWPYGKRPKGKSRRIYWNRKRVLEHRAKMPWYERFDLDRGFINYDAFTDKQLDELLNDQDLACDGDRQNKINKLIETRDADSEYAESIWRDDQSKYMTGVYNERNS